MFKESKTVLDLLRKKKFEAYFIGGKCRSELHNRFHPQKQVDIKDIDIVTNATPDEIKAIFPHSDVRGESFQVVVVDFGGFEFEVATYRKDIYDMKEVKNNKKITKPETEIAESLDEDRSRRDFTINAIAQDSDGNYIDYIYQYRNKKISAMKDIENGIIRAIGNARQRFEEDPLRILRAFRFMSQLGYEIEKQTLKVIESNLNLLEKIPHERISTEMNKLILGQDAKNTLSLMKEIGVFNTDILNSIQNSSVKLLIGLNDIDNEHFKDLDVFNSVSHKVNNGAIIEAWTILLRPLGAEKARSELESIHPLCMDDIEKVEWLIQHYNLINSEDLRNDIFNARTGIVKRHKLMCMKELLLMLSDLHVSLQGKDYEEKSKNLMDAFCSRPYFPEQLKVTGEQIIEIGNEKPGPWITTAKEKLLYKLINSKRFPKEMDKYMELVSESIEEALIEETMKKEGLL